VALTDDGKILERFEIDCAWGNWHEIDAPAPALAPGIKIKIVNGCDPYFKAGDVATLDCLDQYGCWWGTFADGKQWSIGTEEDFEVLT
jgi:hypothetical protein